MSDDFDSRYRAVSSRDARFDGRFFTGVKTTGIYCRPTCPSRTPKPDNVVFFATAGEAVASGFRACRRCRPDAVPASPESDAHGGVAVRALQLIGDGALDAGSVAGLAGQLNVAERQLRRVVVGAVGAGPLTLARQRRAHTARVLIEHTRLPMTEVAFSAGYSSVRQFNAAVRDSFGMSATDLRRGTPAVGGGHGPVVLRLRAVPPFDGAALFGFLGARAIPGVEELTGATYRRSVRLGEGQAVIELSLAKSDVVVAAHIDDVDDVAGVVAATRRLLDLDADPSSIAAALGADALLAGEVRRNPGLRVPGAVDPFELMVRAVLGQQVSVAGARTLAGRVAARFGEPVRAPRGGVRLLFPGPRVIAEADLGGLGLTGARIRTLHAIAAEVAGGSLCGASGHDPDEVRRALLAIPGVGPWTASYIAMRALGDPDALPAGDLGLRRAFERAGLPGDARSIEARSASWRPWRAYAALHLWNSLANPADVES